MPHLVSPNGIQGLRRRKQLEQNLEHITQEMYQRNRELADTNRTLSLLRAIDSMVLESQESLQVVCQRISDALVEATNYPTVALLVRTSHQEKVLDLYGWSIKDKEVPAEFSLARRHPQVDITDKSWFKTEDTTVRIPVASISIADIQELFACTEAMAKRLKVLLPLHTLYCTKLIVRGHMVGVLVAGLEASTSYTTDLLDRLSEPIGIAIDNRLLFEENRRVLLQLQRSNAKLKALDETKDDFISMASHQLRTPLTSVKGYLSMALEGDAGPLNKNQEKLLKQSYMSAQRMVYLIADLLNLSRLNTGKFVIEPVPVNLADVVESEYEQLIETAKARDITLEYHKPEHFSALMLDDTKTHQIVMNLMDNAIYYTRLGGHIDVSVSETPTYIEYRVKDNGIGVPKSERPHLFTKFYRAQNARQARPDGTGLGLFMAKKVIVAQGGSVIFESEEGKGSTFGFRFNKARHTVPPTS